jgi:hypothetical protein
MLEQTADPIQEDWTMSKSSVAQRTQRPREAERTDGERVDIARGKESELREERIDDYLQQSLQDANHLRANLGAASADLMWLSRESAQVIREEFLSGARSAESLRQLAPHIELHLKVLRQLDRFANLDRQIAAGEGTSPSVRS